MTKNILISSTLHLILIFITAVSLPFLAKKPIDLPPIISVELIQIAEKTNIPYAPKAKKIIEEVFNILKLKPKIRRITWSRRAQEYETKIFSGDPIRIAEVVRDLFRKTTQSEQSYSERQMFQVAIERLAREVAAVEKTDYFQSTEKIEQILNKK